MFSKLKFEDAVHKHRLRK